MPVRKFLPAVRAHASREAIFVGAMTLPAEAAQLNRSGETLHRMSGVVEVQLVDDIGAAEKLGAADPHDAEALTLNATQAVPLFDKAAHLLSEISGQ